MDIEDVSKIGREASHRLIDTDEGATFLDGRQWAVCTSWAVQARRVLGDRARIFGFFVSENPSAVAMGRLSDGHDFVLVDDRYILDGWLSEVEGEIEHPLIDLEDPEMRDVAVSFYGDRALWERNLEIEGVIDAEPADVRELALSGFAPEIEACPSP